MITQATLREHAEYKDGNLIAKTNSKARKIGDTISSVTGNGYRVGNILGKSYRIHRLVYLYHFGFIPEQVDHINGNRSDNRIENLRAATSSQNSQNRKATGKSGIKGVHWHKQSKKWIASICIKRKNIHLGSFCLIEDAAFAANSARVSIHGEFYRSQS